MTQTSTPGLSQSDLDNFISLVTQTSGIIPRESHSASIKTCIEKYLKENECTAAAYLDQLQNDKALLDDFINETTVNETYFFREEKQFSVLKESIFPAWNVSHGNLPINIWSAACSYGEEAYSLALIARTCSTNAFITASDINSKAVDHCKKGVFLKTSIRQVDGLTYRDLLLPFRRSDEKIEFNSDVKKVIHTKRINLSKLDGPYTSAILPKNQNIIFLRNVFIYFSQDLRKRILQTITEKCLAADGLIFVSMSEVAQIDSTILPSSLEKVSEGSVFYFHKKS